MSLLASTAYDPATAVSVGVTSATAMTAFDTTNLRLTPTIPASGNALVRARVPVSGATFVPLLGVLEGSTVVARACPVGPQSPIGTITNNNFCQELYVPLSGLTAGSHTWDLAYGVEVVAASGGFKYGGPNDTSGNDAWGAATFEVWDPGPNFLGSKLYDPSTAVSVSTAVASVMQVFDTTNLRVTFTAPASGKVLWRARAVVSGANASPMPTVLLGILESTTVVARQAPGVSSLAGSAATFPYIVHDASGIVTGVSAGSHSWDLAYAIQNPGGSVNYKIKYGGPNDTTANNAWGAIQFELWAC